jgi:hypothetical protein
LVESLDDLAVPRALEPVWAELGDDWARMDSGYLRSEHIEALAENRRNSPLARKVVSDAPAGLGILLDGSERAFRLALERGWIGAIDLEKPIKAEHPDYVAWNKKSMESRSNGREIDVSERMAAAASAIEASTLPMPEKRVLLAKCSNKAAAESTVEPRKGMTAKLALWRRESLSPAVLFLAHGNPHEKDAGAKGRALSDAGWSFLSALAMADDLGDLGIAMRAGADRPGTREWLGVELEREELAKVSSAPSAASAGPLRM